MNRAELLVTHAGPQVSIQDAGRMGMARYGVPLSGPMDRGAFRAANAALDNPLGATLVEVSLGGLTLECTKGRVSIAICGGAFLVGLNGEQHSSWMTATLEPGSTLTIKPGHWGSWTYLAFAGSLVAQKWLGSTSTHGPTGLGGGKLTTGQTLTVADAQVRDTVRDLPRPITARPKNPIRVVQGPQDHFFDPATLTVFFSTVFELTDSYDRMGVRLRGPAIVPAASLDMPSEAIVRGSIQVSGDGIPTVLLADHQTTGGYPKIATVIDIDQDNFVQLRSRSPVSFRRVSPEVACAAARTRKLTQG